MSRDDYFYFVKMNDTGELVRGAISPRSKSKNSYKTESVGGASSSSSYTQVKR